MTELLDKRYRDQLVTWFGLPCNFQFLYKINTDGCSAETFQQKCDGQGPTVLYNTNNTIFGGYLAHSWNSSDKCIEDSRFFLFRLQYNRTFNPLKFPVKNPNCAGYGKNDYGTTFGGENNHDIQAFTNTVTKSGYHSLNVSINIQSEWSKQKLHYQRRPQSDRS